MERKPSPPEAIAAIATAPGRGGIGVVRVSGSGVREMAAELIGAPCPPPRHAAFVRFLDDDKQALDEGLLLFFPGPHSFTGEDVLELHGHGGPVVLRLLLARCIELGARLAEPGEFSRRAFLNGKLDLAQAEGIADLIEAGTEAAARSALRSLSGAFSNAVNAIREQLIELRMLVEASIDFPEEDVDFVAAARVMDRLATLRAQLAEVLDRARQGSLLREGLHVVLVGRPNVGKSSLLNRLAGEERAIVTAIEGTTRDVLRERIQIDGIPLHIIDTAGLRESDDEVERIGIERTWKEIGTADVIIRLVDARHEQVGTEDAVIDAALPKRIPRLTVRNKIDLAEMAPGRHEDQHGVAIALSARHGKGIELLQQELLHIVGWTGHAEDSFLARARHLEALRKAAAFCADASEHGHALEILAEDLRLAHEALGEIVGAFTSDDLLGVIFSRFCIGK